MNTYVDDAFRLCRVFNERDSQEKKAWRTDMFTFACMVNADKENRKKVLDSINKENIKPLTKEEERAALLKLKDMLQ